MDQKKILLLPAILVFFFTVTPRVANALTLWQYGLEDKSYSEFKTVEGGAFETQSNFNMGNVNVDRPYWASGNNSMGYLYSSNPNPKYSHVNRATSQTMTFDFTLEKDYLQLDLSYGRFGSEIDYIYFDGVELFIADGTAEGQWDLFEFAITGDIRAGDHTLTIVYGGGDADNGHLIDFVRLENGIPSPEQVAPVPEPGTIFLLSSGFFFLFIYWRRRNFS